MSETNEYIPTEAEEIPEAENTETALAVVQPPMSPTAARDAGIAKYLASAYGHAGTLKITPEETKALKADFPDECFVTGAAGKDNLIYLDPKALRDRLDEVLGMGSWSLVPIRTWNEEYKVSTGPAIRVYRECVLIIRGVFITQATGDMTYYPNNQSTNYGDAYQGSESHALRRCLKNFGVGLQAYSKPFQAGWFERRKNSGHPATVPSDPPPAAAPPPTAPPATPRKRKPLEMPTANTRAAALSRLEATEDGPARATLHGYLVALGWIEADKPVEQWPLRFVPMSPDELESIKVGMASYSLNAQTPGYKVVMPYQPHGLDQAPLDAKPVTPAPAQAQPPAPEPPSPPEPELVPAKPGWRDFVIPFGKTMKGKKLAELPKDQVAEFAANFTVKEFVEDAKGVKNFYAPEVVASQKAFREALDQAAAEFKGKEQKP